MGKPQIRIDLAAPEPAYRQIVMQIRTLIVEGSLSPGDSLPSIRRLALDLGIHFNTVAEAYRALASEGWLEVSHGRSARVAMRPPATAGKTETENLRQRLRHLLAEMRARGVPVKVIRSEISSLLEE